MLLGIDHLVIAVREPDAAAGQLERDVGLAFTTGGRHEVMGTFNRLAFLGDTYVELIGVFDGALVDSSVAFGVGRAAKAVLDDGREGLATYALATDDVAADARRLRAGGSPIGEPVAGSRTLPDGGIVRWTTAFPPLGPDLPPFLIEHEYAGAEWGDEARAERATFRHPAGGPVRMTALELPVPDLATAVEAYGRMVGVTFSEGWRAVIGDQEVRLRARASGGQADAPVVHLRGEPGTPSLDIVDLGLRWLRSGAGPMPQVSDPDMPSGRRVPA